MREKIPETELCSGPRPLDGGLGIVEAARDDLSPMDYATHVSGTPPWTIKLRVE